MNIEAQPIKQRNHNTNNPNRHKTADSHTWLNMCQLTDLCANILYQSSCQIAQKNGNINSVNFQQYPLNYVFEQPPQPREHKLQITTSQLSCISVHLTPLNQHKFNNWHKWFSLLFKMLQVSASRTQFPPCIQLVTGSTSTMLTGIHAINLPFVNWLYLRHMCNWIKESHQRINKS